MKPEFLLESPFQGWPNFLGNLLKFDAVDTLWHIQKVILSTAEQTDGIFLGIPPIFPMNVHVIIKEYVANLPPIPLPVPNVINADLFYPVLTNSCRQVNDLRARHPALRPVLILPANQRTEQHLRKLWFHHLEQYGMYWAPKYELARSQRMFSEIWVELNESQKVNLKSHTSTSFLDSSYHLLLSLGIWRNGGRVDDVRVLMSKSGLADAQLKPLLDMACLPLSDVQTTLMSNPKYPDAIDNIFHRYPLIRLGEWGVMAPMPNLILQGWELRNLFEGLECARGNVPDGQGGVEYYRAFGVVFEEYARELLAELAALAAPSSSIVSPFKYKAKTAVDSPDGFIVTSKGVLVFEAKCYRVPHSAYEQVQLSGFLSWFANLLGTNDKGRKPLNQGAAFFQEWQKGNVDISAKLSSFNSSSYLYVIISYDDLPMFSHWSIFRRWYESEHLESHTHSLWQRTLVISIRELEVLVAAGQSAGQLEGPTAPFDPFSLLAEYVKYCQETRDVDQTDGFKNSLRNWLIEKYPACRDAMPSILRDANRRLFEKAMELGFPEGNELKIDDK